MGALIKIDFGLGLAVGLSLVLVLVYQQWLFYTRDDGRAGPTSGSHFYQCPFCTQLFYDFCDDDIVQCPRCHSLLGADPGNDKEGGGGHDEAIGE